MKNLSFWQFHAQNYSHLSAWYYGSSFQALENGYLEGFSVYTNAPNPSNVDVWLYGPFSTSAECDNVVNGSGPSALNSANSLIKHQSFGVSDINYSTPTIFTYTDSIYGLGYNQSDPNTKVTVAGVLEYMKLKEGKYRDR